LCKFLFRKCAVLGEFTTCFPVIKMIMMKLLSRKRLSTILGLVDEKPR